MSEPASISTGIAKRYATAIFELAKDDGALSQLRSEVDSLAEALDQSADLRELISSPVYSRDEQQSAISAIASKMGLSQMLSNTLRLMASKRRLFVLPAMLRTLRELIAEASGEVTAEVRAASPLDDAQRARLAQSLKASIGRDVNINLSVDEKLIGGLVIKVGSKMIDTSIRSKLNALQNTMKEVG
ncbi:ATP synthase subunit delta [Profundibacterium mesophilum KAUST100406-0324]|uniref:ATP synthase subunit delta n=1 Tax=Profundibacterium mesophilum KAUST100406-0324 TaxID=1037889 RepID=A0A921TDK2_9RHOB|nr:ATP synthase subunit delta [Profundibacterium mesophilum KAUST100406-0324]